ncbi:hypothetical protein [Paraburkholderia sp. J76]|uniref:hypothetical protein n=1 Tax=Paraburkholderia sp. J76 TaxID=2805439 RepID=UPI002ABE0D4C|nr:hypothetical protein [Paraburkholderia sp. J76]
MRFPLFRRVMTLSLAAVACSACSAFDPANPDNADPKISFERAHQVAQDNNLQCLWARGADPKTGSYHCVPTGRVGHDDTRLAFVEIGLRVTDGGVRLPEGAGAPLRVATIDGKLQLVQASIENRAYSMREQQGETRHEQKPSTDALKEQEVHAAY